MPSDYDRWKPGSKVDGLERENQGAAMPRCDRCGEAFFEGFFTRFGRQGVPWLHGAEEKARDSRVKEEKPCICEKTT